ncbi:hypothetical protein [Leuconostoc gasicomitatum]|uniref:hypothetical protein n=1 Tax=Leuconostoc gasicomitatum TaxID=115778 RepID=UPI001CC7678B|nr:hypothetical protein [Leuconostoc gasicomitatum]MBZ5958155.1 hypothetical protein [Leuconostoc gasicomitatum]
MSEETIKNKINNSTITNGLITVGVLAITLLSPMNYGTNNNSFLNKSKLTTDSGTSNKKQEREAGMVDNLFGSLKQNADHIEVTTELKNFKNSTTEIISKLETASNSQYRTLVETLKSIENKIDQLPSKEYVNGKISDSEARTIKWVIGTGISVMVLALGVFTWYTNSTSNMINVVLTELSRLKK